MLALLRSRSFLPVAAGVSVVVFLGISCSGEFAAVPEPQGPQDPTDPPPDPDPMLGYGMNPSFLNWTARSIVFADAMTRSSEFLLYRSGGLTPVQAPTISLSASPALLGAGWPDFTALQPGEGAGALIFGAMQGTLPDGRVEPYVLTWEGTGDCRLIGTGVEGEGRRLDRFVEVYVDPTAEAGNANLAWVCVASDAQDPVRNVHVWLPGTEATRPLFWEPYVQKLEAMNLGAGPHSWRPLDWNRINSYGATEATAAFEFDFAGRIMPSSPSQGTRRGMCVEFQVALCNRLGADLHFQLPHRAGISSSQYDMFVLDVLRRIRFGSQAVSGINGDRAFAPLDSSLNLTIELSNEIWNASSPSNTWFQDRGRDLGVSLHEAIAQELMYVWDLADAVFTGGESATLRHYIGGFIANPGFVHGILNALEPGTRVDAIGPAAYFYPPTESVDGWLSGAVDEHCPNCPTVAEVISASCDTIAALETSLVAHRGVADGYVNPDGSSPRLELYEAGQSYLAGLSPWRAAAQAAQSHPDLYYAYVDHLIPALVAARVDLVHWYSFMTEQNPASGVSVGFGIWGGMDEELTLPVLEQYFDEGLPKAAAVYRGPPLR
jgi:hypothetical protein